MNSYLETAIAVVLVVLIFSVITYVIQELIAANLEYRGKMLKNSIQLLLDSPTATVLTNQIYKHPQIQKLQKNLTRLPSYISSNNFTIALIDIVAKRAPAPSGNLYTDFLAGIQFYAAGNTSLKEWLESLAKFSSSITELENNFEKWYEDYMDRVTGWYKSKSTIITRIIAVVVVLSFNLNVINITTTIYNNGDLRARLNATAENISTNQQLFKVQFEQTINTRIQHIKDSLASELNDSLKKQAAEVKLEAAKDALFKSYTKDRIDEVNSLLKSVDDKELPIGWKGVKWADFQDSQWLLVLLGWFLGVIAISMGAPFWFDLLLKLVNVRKAGIKPEEKQKN